MMPAPRNSDPNSLQASLSAFADFRRTYLQGNERSEAHIFLDRFFQALGHGGVPEAGAILERGIRRPDDGGTSYADLEWRPRVLIEMKRAGADLTRYFAQAFEYWMYLVPDRPRYVILCNFDEFWIYDFDKQLEEPIDVVALDDLARRWETLGFMLPVEQRPVFRNDLEEVTRDSAARVARVFNALVDRGVDRETSQRFILQAVMAMFSEDIGLLPTHSFTNALEDSLDGGSAFDLIFGLFQQMNTPGATPSGRYEGTPYFNGGLFREIVPFEIEREELELVHHACQRDWSRVKPVIFGTLFEQSLGRDERHAFGAHFTTEADIQRVVIPCIVRPWRDRIEAAETVPELSALESELHSYRVLDPACGSGNFLYVAFRELRRLERQLAEKRRNLEGTDERFRGTRARRAPRAGTEQRAFGGLFVSPQQFFGIDIRPFAIEVAKVTLMLARKLAADELGDEHVVLPLDDLDPNFIAEDALRIDWPQFDVCIGNPPYLGRRRIVQERGADYSAWLAEAFPEIGGVSDYVAYFFRKTHDLLPAGSRAGLVGTNTIRQSDTRTVSLDYILQNDGVIFEAVSRKPWSGDAVVDVSIVNWIKGEDLSPKILWLDEGGTRVELDHIPSSLSLEIDVSQASQLRTNRDPKCCFQGQTPGHTKGFVLTYEQARDLVAKDRGSAEVIHPFLTGDELNSTGAPGRFIIDIPATDVVEASRWSAAFEHVKRSVLPVRQARAREESERNEVVLARNPNARINRHHQNFLERWWQLAYRRVDMLEAISKLSRYIALSIVAVQSKPSLYAFVSPEIWPAASLQVFAFEDDYSLGVLQSRYHRLWFEERCSTMRRDLRYTPNTVFDSFPWPQSPSDAAIERVVQVAADLQDLRESKRESGISLGRQYDLLRSPGDNPLRDLHVELDRAVAEAYNFSDDNPLAQLLALNLELFQEEAGIGAQLRAPGTRGLTKTKRTNYRIEPLHRL